MKPHDEDVNPTLHDEDANPTPRNYVAEWIYENDPYEYESNKEWPDYYDMDLPPIA